MGMDFEENHSSAVADFVADGDGDAVDVKSDAHHGLDPAVAAAEDREEHREASGSVDGLQEGNGDVSGAHIAAAPGHSPSFASLGDTSTFESFHAPRLSDTFEGFEPPRLSQSQEVQETPKVARPEGLSFATPAAVEPAEGRSPGSSEAPEDAGSEVPRSPVVSDDQGRNEVEDFTSPIANLVERPQGGAAPQTLSGPTGGQPMSASPSGGQGTPEASREPRIIPRKIPGHELLGSFMGMTNAGMPRTREASEVLHALSVPVAEKSTPAPTDSAVSFPQDAPIEQESAALQPEESTQPQPQPEADVSPLREESGQAIPPDENLEDKAMDSANADFTAPEGALPTSKNPLEAPDARPVDEGPGEEVVAKSSEVGTEPEAVSTLPVSTLPQTQTDRPPVSFAFRQAEPGTEVLTTAVAVPPKPVSFLGKFTTMATKKWRGPSDNDLKKMVLIPEYLGKDMANAVNTEGAATPDGPPLGVSIEPPICPVLVFINSKSGGRLGPELMEHFREVISPNQVYDLSETKPNTVLRYGVGCLDRMANAGDECARKTRENLRILVAGGDGTVGWVLSSVRELRALSPSGICPPVGVIPLGTGNDLSRSFGWGGEFSSTARASLKRCLVKAMGAKSASLDTWQAVVMPTKSVAADDIHFPHAFYPQQHVPLPSSVAGEKHEKDETAPAFEGLFFNYFSIGMDAQVAYGFHHLRDEKPWLARGRVANQMIYSSYGCTQGWFCTACSAAPRARGVGNIVKVLIKKKGSTLKDWEEVHIPSNIRAIVILNLQSYAGGRNPWGNPSAATRQQAGLEEPKPDDGLLEIMGLKDGWHTAFVMLTVRTAVRLCQAEAIRLELRGNARRKAYLQMDGEPWMQPLGHPNEEPTIVTIEKLAEPSMLLKR